MKDGGMTNSLIQEAAQLIADSSFTIALTGAGISVDSGIPDFRSPGGLWERFDPMDFTHIESFRRDPERVWTMLREMQGMIVEAKSNAGHLALADLERMGRLKAVITQNIDNLHQDAGNSDVIEFHGNAKRLTCLHCGRRYGSDEAAEGKFGDPPRCTCGEILKPDVVFFGEAIPPEAYRRSMLLAEQAEVMMVLGTSAQVAPANLLPEVTRASGGRLVEVNLEPTHLSRHYGAIFLKGFTSEVLPSLVEAVRACLS